MRFTILTICIILFTLSAAPVHGQHLHIREGTITPLGTANPDEEVSKLYKRGKLPVLAEGVYRYKATFNNVDSITTPTLFFGAMYYPCIVSLNGHQLYRWGAMDGSAGMVNYRSNVILFPPDLLTDTNTLTIDFWTDGLTMGLPNLWIGNFHEVSWQADWFNAINVSGTRVGVTLAFLIFIMSLCAYIFIKDHPARTLYYAFFSISTALTFHIFLFNSGAIDHVIQTKIFRTATFLMGLSLFYLIADLTGIFKSKRLNITFLVIHLPLFIMIWLAESKFEIETLVGKTVPFLLAPVMLLTIITAIRAVKQKPTAENLVIAINYGFIVYATYNDLSSLARKTLPDIWLLTYGNIIMTFTAAGLIIARQIAIYTENMKNRAELKHLNDSLESANRELETARELAVQESVARESFLKTIAHELRTPLTGLLGGVNLIADDESMPAHLKRPAFYMKSSFHRLFVTVSNLFDFIEIKRGSIAIVSHPFRVAELIDPVLEYYRDMARAKGISLIILPSKDLPSELYGDSEHLLQVIDNLIGNAVKFTKSGGVSCELMYEKSVLSVTIKDTGVGISADKQEAMFRAFSRGEEFSFSQRYEGVGLGLAIVDAVVRAMRGTLTFSSVAEKGTTFSVSLPMITANNRHIEFKKKKRILVVEDNVINSLMVIKQLESAKFITESVCNGKEAVECCRTNNYDAILMDIQMPVMDGLTATKEIRQFNVNTPIIALTANGDRSQCLRAGMNEVLMKPISADKLISVVSNMIVYAEKGL